MHDLHLLSRALLLSPPTFPGFGSVRSLVKVHRCCLLLHCSNASKVILPKLACHSEPPTASSHYVFEFIIQHRFVQGIPLALSLAVAILIPSPSTGRVLIIYGHVTRAIINTPQLQYSPVVWLPR
jgi:hypothetical protein